MDNLLNLNNVVEEQKVQIWEFQELEPLVETSLISNDVLITANTSEIKELEQEINVMQQAEVHCAICITDYIDNAVIFKCGHSMCITCYEHWLKEKKYKCPFCVREINLEELSSSRDRIEKASKKRKHLSTVNESLRYENKLLKVDDGTKEVFDALSKIQLPFTVLMKKIERLQKMVDRAKKQKFFESNK